MTESVEWQKKPDPEGISAQVKKETRLIEFIREEAAQKLLAVFIVIFVMCFAVATYFFIPAHMSSAAAEARAFLFLLGGAAFGYLFGKASS